MYMLFAHHISEDRFDWIHTIENHQKKNEKKTRRKYKSIQVKDHDTSKRRKQIKKQLNNHQTTKQRTLRTRDGPEME